MKYKFLRFPEGRSKALTFSYDDGHKCDIRLADIFTSFGIKCTFNLKSNPMFSKEEAEEHMLSKGHEIALHGAEHRALGAARAIEGIREILDCRIKLENDFGRIIRGYAYSDFGIGSFHNGASYEGVRSYISELDLIYARALSPYNRDLTLPTDWLQWHPTAHHNDPELPNLIEKFLSADTSSAVYCASRYPRLLYIWGHSFEFNNKDNWYVITEICEKLAGKDEIWYATNAEICEYVKAYESLIHSADGRRIYNPTLLTVWFDIDGKLYSLPSGETLIVE